MNTALSVRIGGKAGQDLQTIGYILAETLARGSLHVFANQDNESRIRGGHNFFQVRASDWGFSLVDILQPCVTFNRVNTYQWYRKRVYKLDSAYDPKDRKAALEKAQEWSDRIPINVIYTEERSTYEDHNPKIVQPLG
ncbi:MAG: 2-oxoacid:acceptor oxidoreductase family protein [Candidatus Bathyarchaeia archaeon]